MPPFVRDLQLHVHTPDGEKVSVKTPPDVTAAKFLDDLREPLHLRGPHWHIYDREDRRLDPNKSLGDNGVREGHELFFREESRPRPREEPVQPQAPSESQPSRGGEKVLIRCDNGHFYDPKKHAACPYCGVPSGDTATTPKKKEPVVRAPEERTRPAGFSQGPDTGDDQPTIRIGMGETRIDPVVGWLVCMHGPEKGRDYRIRAENNTIGRSEDQHISIKDEMISRERHAFITFDPQTNRFYLRPGEARGLVHRNGNVVFQAEELHAYDQILLGQTKLVFVPLCGEHFKWE